MKLFAWGMLIFLFLGLLPSSLSMIRATESARTVRVGAYNNEPKIYKDLNDKPAGVFVDIINYIAQKENWNVEYVWGQWDTDLNRLQKGEIDIMPDVALSPEREKLYDFTTETVLKSWAVVYVQKGSIIDSITDLEGKKISIVKSSVYEKGQESIDQYLKAFGLNADIVEVGNYRDALDLLQLGKVDAAVVSHIFGLANEKGYSNIKTTQIFLKPTELKFALPKGAPNNPYFIGKLDYWVKNIKSGQDGFLHETLEKYGLSTLEQEPQSQAQTKASAELIPTWVPIVALGLMLLMTIPLFTTDILRFRK